MFRLSYAFILLGIISSCGPKIIAHTGLDPNYDLKNFTTIRWDHEICPEPGDKKEYTNVVIDRKIKAAVNQQLSNKNYVLAEENADLSIHYHIIIEDQCSMEEGTCGKISPYWKSIVADYNQYQEGTLIIDILEANSNHLIWRGWALVAFDFIHNKDEMDFLINTSVEKIFKKFPKSLGVVPGDKIASGSRNRK